MVEFGAIVEGTGDEISAYAGERPQRRFRLITLHETTVTAAPARPDAAKWNEAMRIIESFRGKLPTLPLDLTSRDSIYD